MSLAFSYAVLASDIPSAGKRYRVEADADARKRLAEALGVVEIAALAADLEVRPVRGSAVSVRGSLASTVVQTDVVTLDPVAQQVSEKVDVTLMRAEDVAQHPKRKEALVDATEAEGPDLYHHGRIDLGMIVSEHLALGLDLYPRASGVDFPGHVEDDPSKDPSPFAALAKLKDHGGSSA
jgi:uncharacterized metal-binding protein YceD (DUF177 family)